MTTADTAPTWETLNIPVVAQYAETSTGICIISGFGDTWCTDTYDEETNNYIGAPEIFGGAPRPDQPTELCANCLRAAQENEDGS